MTFDEYFKITRFKNRKSFNRPSLLFVLLVVILLISITTFIRRWCQYCSDGLSVVPPQSVIGAFLSFVYAAYTSVRTSQRILQFTPSWFRGPKGSNVALSFIWRQILMLRITRPQHKSWSSNLICCSEKKLFRACRPKNRYIYQARLNLKIILACKPFNLCRQLKV